MINRYFFSVVAILCANVVTFALPADSRPKQYIQPDGTTVTIKKCGDEHGHYYLTEDGYLLMKQDGYMRYANVDEHGNIVVSGLNASPAMLRTNQENLYLSTVDMDKVYEAMANTKQSRKRPASRDVYSQGLGLFPGSHFPLSGSPKGMAILVEFQDKKFSMDDPQDYYYRYLNQPGFNDHGGTGSVSDYFYDNSMGVFTPDFDVYGPVTLPNPYKYYGENARGGDDMRAEEMIIDGCTILDEVVDFSAYDYDEDGFVDNIYVIYAGEGEATSTDEDTVWPHSYELSVNYSYLWVDGVIIDSYACSNEVVNGVPEGIGNFVHEFSHVLGLPDLYSTVSNMAFTPGEWTVMDQGSYNNDSRTPPYYTAFERYALGWISPKILGESEDKVTLDNIAANECCLIPTADENEYFLLENRQQVGWDEYLPGHGMLVWHIHYVPRIWEMNTVNNNVNHQYVDIIEADNRRSERNRDGDTFPGTKNITSFTSTTTPALKTWADVSIDCPITDITEIDGLISFVSCEGKSGIASISADNSDISVEKGRIIVSDTDRAVKIYSADGNLVASSVGGTSINVPAGIYIVACGNDVRKVLVP